MFLCSSFYDNYYLSYIFNHHGDTMTNIINSQYINNTNSITAKGTPNFSKKQKPDVFIPQTLPKYSLDKVLSEKELLRKQYNYQNYKTSQSNHPLKKLSFTALIAVLGLAVYKHFK